VPQDGAPHFTTIILNRIPLLQPDFGKICAASADPAAEDKASDAAKAILSTIGWSVKLQGK